MKTICAALCLALVLAGLPARADPRGDGEIRAWLKRWDAAFAARDTAAVIALYAPGVVAYDIVPPLQYRGREAYRADYQAYFDQYSGPLVVEERGVHVATDGRLGFAYGLERVAGTLKTGERTDGWTRFTTVFRKIDGRWYAIHDHISVPADFTTGKALLDLKP